MREGLCFFAALLEMRFLYMSVLQRIRVTNVPGFAVRIPKRIDVEPCIQAWQNKDRQYDEESEEILIQVPQVIFKNPENITHIGQYSCQT